MTRRAANALLALHALPQPSATGEGGCHEPHAVTDEALTYLRRIVAAHPGGRHASHAMAAASRLVEWARWREEFDEDKRRHEFDPVHAMNELLDNEQKLLEWMDRVHPVLKARVASP